MELKKMRWKASFAFCMAVALVSCGGESGGDGAAGGDGLSALVKVSDEGPGANCAVGGSRVDVGLDKNSDGELQEDEIASTNYICDGKDGDPGAKGDPGQDGAKGDRGPGGATGSCAGGSFVITSVSLEDDEWGEREYGQTYDVTVVFEEDPGDDITFFAVGAGGEFADGFERVSGSDVEFRAPWTFEPNLPSSNYAIIATDGCGMAVGTFDLKTPAGPQVRVKLSSDKPALPLGGGDVEICWTSRNADRCSLYGISEDGEEFSFDGDEVEGCETVSLTSSSEMEVTCVESEYYMTAQASVEIVVGPAIVEFKALTTTALSPNEDTVDFAWTTANVDGCELVINEEPDEVDVNVSEDSPYQVQFDESAEVYLKCVDADGNSVTSDAIFVATEALIYDFEVTGFDTWSGNTVEFGWKAKVKNASSCEAKLSNAGEEASRQLYIYGETSEGDGTIDDNGYFSPYNPNYDFILTITCEDLAGESTSSEQFVLNPGPKIALETVGSPLMDEPGDLELYWTTSEVSDCKLFIDENGESVAANVSSDDPVKKTFSENAEVYLECVDEESNPVKSSSIGVFVSLAPAIMNVETTVEYYDDRIFEGIFVGEAYFVDDCDATVMNGDVGGYANVNMSLINTGTSGVKAYYLSGSVMILGDYDDTSPVELSITCEDFDTEETVTVTVEF